MSTFYNKKLDEFILGRIRWYVTNTEKQTITKGYKIYNIYFKERLVNNITSQINEIFSGSLDVLTNLPSKNIIETIKQIESKMIVRNYSGFLND